jgi:hypothetical protein
MISRLYNHLVGGGSRRFSDILVLPRSLLFKCINDPEKKKDHTFFLCVAIESATTFIVNFTAEP